MWSLLSERDHFPNTESDEVHAPQPELEASENRIISAEKGESERGGRLEL